MSVQVNMADGVVTVTLDRPERRNATTGPMIAALAAAVRTADADDSVRLVLFRAAGPVFCAGNDMDERKGLSPEAMQARREVGLDAYAAIEACQRPCVAVVQGACIGSGCGIVMMCDFVLASDRASFRFPEAAIGSVGATQHLPRLVGKAMAKELLFTARSVAADEALRIGLVNRVVALDALDDEVARLTTEIRGAFPLTTRLMKQCIDWGTQSDLRTGMAYERMAIERCLAGPEWREGIARFGTERKA